MSPSTSDAPSEDAALDKAKKSFLALSQHCRASLSAVAAASPPKPPAAAAEAEAAVSISPLQLLHDTATLAKAHTTRLSIALRPPNPLVEGATKFLQELTTSIVPSLLAGVELTTPEAHGRALRAEVVKSVDAVLAALEELVGDIGKEAGGRGRLLNTGVVWDAADRLIRLRDAGLTGVVDGLVKSYGGVLQDAIEELKEWVEDETPEAEDDGERAGSEDEEDDFWDAPKRKLPQDDTQTRDRIAGAMKKMKLVTILFGAGRKRRLGVKSDSRLVTDIGRLDGIADVAKAIPDLADELAMSYYEGDLDEALRLQTSFQEKSRQLADLLLQTDDGTEDIFSKWFRDCREALL